MKRSIVTIVSISLLLGFYSKGADERAASPQSTTNLFSNWVGASTNLSVSTKCPPWGCSFTAYVPIRTNSSTPVVIDEVVQQHRLRQQREKIFSAPPYSEAYTVHIGR